jgi:hypothetical protein
MSYFSTGQSSPTPPSQHSHKTRYKRPETKKYMNSAPAELFAEGTTPTEAQMWRERFSRRMIDRERRKKGREAEVDKRRGPIHIEEDEAKAQEDDEEARRLPSHIWMTADNQIFRRLMVLQRQREQRNAQISYEQDIGGSDPISPEFWDSEEEERALEARLQASESYNARAGPSKDQFQTPQRQPQRRHPIIREDQEEEEDWAAEAARAEEVEREAEELELARQVEESYRQEQHQSHPHHHGDTSIEVDDIEMDWDVDMDF